MDEQLQSHLNKKNRAVVLRIAITQFAVTLLITLLLLTLVGYKAAYSALLAGVISTFATFYSGRRFFSGKTRTAKERLATLYLTELMKIVFLAAAFIVSFMLFDVHFISFIGAYLATIIVFWLAMILPVFGVQVKTNN